VCGRVRSVQGGGGGVDGRERGERKGKGCNEVEGCKERESYKKGEGCKEEEECKEMEMLRRGQA
jgi:hypothetical protein